MPVLVGTVAYITGGASGIGRAVTERYLDEGASVVVLDANAHAIEANPAHDQLASVHGDVTKWEDHERAIALAVEKFGGVDTVVANAGVTDGFEPLAALSAVTASALMAHVLSVNTTGMVLAAHAALRQLVERRGSIILTLSNASHRPGGGGVAYTASKHASLGVMRQLAFELAPHVRVNGVAPGGTTTDIRASSVLGVDEAGLGRSTMPADVIVEVLKANTPLGVASRAADHAGAYVFLADRSSSAVITGAVIDSDAGLGVRGIMQVRGGDGLMDQIEASSHGELQ